MRQALSVCAMAALAMIAAAGCTVDMPLFRSEYSRLREEVIETSPRVIEWNKIALIEVDGFIGERGGLFAGEGTTAADVKQRLKMAADDYTVRGVLLRIDSPGGEVTSCDIIYNEIRAFERESGKPVVAFMMSSATSGAYYAALAADRIIAHPTTVTGNVGVIMEFVNVEKLLGMIGLQTVTVKSGEKKDMASPLRPISAEEMAILERVNKSLFERFLGEVKARRKLTAEASRTVADGRIFTADEALTLGLVDRIGDMADALDEVKRMAGIRHAEIVAYRARPRYNANVYSKATWQDQEPLALTLSQTMRTLTGQRGARFLYLWAPSP